MRGNWPRIDPGCCGSHRNPIQDFVFVLNRTTVHCANGITEGATAFVTFLQSTKPFAAAAELRTVVVKEVKQRKYINL